MKASEVLQECINDIERGKWICGNLHQKDIEKAHANPKEMACAVGLVSLNSGDTRKLKIKEKDISYYLSEKEWKDFDFKKESNGAACSLHVSEGIKAGDVFEVARYPKKNSPKETKDAIKYLYQSLPEDPEGIGYYLKAKSLADKVDVVVNYNDSAIEGQPEEAKAWFEKARKLAINDGN